MNPRSGSTTKGMADGQQSCHPAEQTLDVKIDPHNPMARRTFRRPRAGRACGTCHSRRVRCDAGSRGLPCTNCLAFSLDCSIPPKKKKKREGVTVSGMKGRTRGSRSSRDNTVHDPDFHETFASSPDDFADLILEADQHIKQEPDDTKMYLKLIKPETTKSTIKDPGRVAYLAEQSNMALLVTGYDEPVGAVHYPLPKTEKSLSAKSSRMDEIELAILKKRGALSLPPKELCDELVHAFFKWIAPIVPIINRSSFMQRYRDSDNPPSLLLMQTIFLAGSRVCTTPMLLDGNDSSIPASTLFYQRAKALYDADYEQDRVTIVQALILMGWYWEDAGKVTKNVFYWNGLATTIAQGCGMHRSTKHSRLSTSDRRLWKRIWWTLFTRDRSVAAALGRPPHIHLIDSDVEMICEEDFMEERSAQPDPLLVHFFLQYVKICDVMDLVLLQNYSVSSRGHQHDAMALTQCDMALADWLQNCPQELRWGQSRYSFWRAYLYCIYQTTSCLLHRAHLPPVPSPPVSTSLSRSPAFQSAHAITSVMESLIAHNELRYSPPNMIHSLFSALMVQIYELHTLEPAAALFQRKRVMICMDALERVAEIWLVAKMVHDLFEAILVSSGFENCLPRHENQKNLDGVPIRSRQFADRKEYGPSLAPSPTSGSESSNKILPLTPGLLDHLDAALKSAMSPPKSESSDNCSRSVSEGFQSSNFLDHQKEEPHYNFMPNMAQELYPAAFQPEDPYTNQAHLRQNDFLDMESLAWIEPTILRTPAPTGLNTAEWFQFFGIR